MPLSSRGTSVRRVPRDPQTRQIPCLGTRCSGPAVGEPLTLARVDEALSAVAAETGPGSAERRLRALTNLRVVRDPTSSTGWKIDIGPFPGWKDVPTW